MGFSFDELNKTFDDFDGEFPSETGSLTGNKSTEARLCAVQAIYQSLVSEDDLPMVTEQFIDHHLSNRKADKKLFNTIVEAVTVQQETYLQTIADNLNETWTIERVGNVEKALLLAAIAELFANPQTPTKVILNEFINISKGFFAPEEVSFINGLLDTVSKTRD